MSIKDTLARWGASKTIDTPPNGYPGLSAFARLMRNPGESTDRDNRPAPLDDDQHCALDAIVSDMALKKPEHHNVICLTYISGYNDAQVGELLRLSRSSVRTLRENAEHWIEAKLDERTGCIY